MAGLLGLSPFPAAKPRTPKAALTETPLTAPQLLGSSHEPKSALIRHRLATPRPGDELSQLVTSIFWSAVLTLKLEQLLQPSPCLRCGLLEKCFHRRLFWQGAGSFCMLWQAEIFLLWVLIVNRLRASRQGYEIWRAAFPERQKKKKKELSYRGA